MANMKKKMRFPIRVKLSILSMATIAVAVSSLGVFLMISYSSSAKQAAQDTLESATTNAKLALDGVVSSLEISMKLLANQIGYNTDFSNSILNASSSSEDEARLKTALSGSGLTGDGSTIIGAMDYLIITDENIVSATMYSPFIDASKPIANRLFNSANSQIEATPERYAALSEHPGDSYWFFTEDSLFVWKALVNYGEIGRAHV